MLQLHDHPLPRTRDPTVPTLNPLDLPVVHHLTKATIIPAVLNKTVAVLVVLEDLIPLLHPTTTLFAVFAKYATNQGILPSNAITGLTIRFNMRMLLTCRLSTLQHALPPVIITGIQTLVPPTMLLQI